MVRDSSVRTGLGWLTAILLVCGVLSPAAASAPVFSGIESHLGSGRVASDRLGVWSGFSFFEKKEYSVNSFVVGVDRKLKAGLAAGVVIGVSKVKVTVSSPASTNLSLLPYLSWTSENARNRVWIAAGFASIKDLQFSNGKIATVPQSSLPIGIQASWGLPAVRIGKYTASGFYYLPASFSSGLYGGGIQATPSAPYRFLKTIVFAPSAYIGMASNGVGTKGSGDGFEVAGSIRVKIQAPFVNADVNASVAGDQVSYGVTWGLAADQVISGLFFNLSNDPDAALPGENLQMALERREEFDQTSRVRLGYRLSPGGLPGQVVSYVEQIRSDQTRSHALGLTWRHGRHASLELVGRSTDAASGTPGERTLAVEGKFRF